MGVGRIVGQRVLWLAGLTALAACAGDVEPPVSEPPPLPPPVAVEPPAPPPPPPPPPTTVPREPGLVAGREVGGAAARYLRPEDRPILEQTTQRALETGQAGKAVRWSNPATGASGTITPQPTFPMGGKSCREFHQTLVAGGTKSTGYGTACRGPDGIWLIDQDG
jgi:surface antigen